jgi:hypothetical protein
VALSKRICLFPLSQSHFSKKVHAQKWRRLRRVPIRFAVHSPASGARSQMVSIGWPISR